MQTSSFCTVKSSTALWPVCVIFFLLLLQQPSCRFVMRFTLADKRCRATQNAPWHFIGWSCVLRKTKSFISALSFPPWWIANNRELQAALFPNGPPGLLSSFAMRICVVKKKQKTTLQQLSHVTVALHFMSSIYYLISGKVQKCR